VELRLPKSKVVILKTHFSWSLTLGTPRLQRHQFVTTVLPQTKKAVLLPMLQTPQCGGARQLKGHHERKLGQDPQV